MVKLEDADGEVAFINPGHVTALTTVNAITTKVWDVGGKPLDVRGTLDEVHAKLFPPVGDVDSTDERRLAARWALEKVAFIYAERLPEDVVRAARKALGREGA